MPPRVARGKRSRPNVERSGTTLQGWEFIQETILSHDENMIADFADDIDTLLVFAGLFSAVLTAFLVVSIVQLQPDNSALSSQLLSLIALQNGAPSRMQPFLNATAELLPTSTTFRAPASVVTINTLWFTSLVLALAAALLGILAKQWCREFLRWHNSILPPRENVLLRQIRFEAWQDWRVPGVIAFIPAFLETALILFFAGLLVFIPGFSARTMTIVVFIAIAATLSGSAVLTLLPAFHHSCSFQSPTGWAIVRVAKAVRESALVATSGTLRLLASICDCVNLAPEWLDTVWSFYNDRRGGWSGGDHEDWRAHNLSVVRKLSSHASIIPGVENLCAEWTVELLRPHLAALDILQTSLLMRALSWVRHGSNTDHLHGAILECLPSIHVSGSTYEPAYDGRRVPSRFLSSVHALYPTDIFSVYRMLRSFQQVAQNSQRTAAMVSPHVSYQRYMQSGPFIVAFDTEWLNDHQTAYSARHRDPVAVEVGYYLVLSDILLLVDDWVSAGAFGIEREYLTEQIALLLCMLQLIPSDAFQAVQVAGPRLTWQWAQTLEEVYRKLAPHTEAYRHGLISMCVELSCLLGPVRFVQEEDSKEHRMTVNKESLYDVGAPYESCPANSVKTWAVLAVDIYGTSNDYRDRNKRHAFVVSVTRAFETMLRALLTTDFARDNSVTTPLAELLRCITRALRWSITHFQPDCGTLEPLPWVNVLLRCYEHVHNHPGTQIPLMKHEELRPTFLLILRLLDTSFRRELLTGLTIAADYKRLLVLLDHPELPDLPPDLKLDSIKARPRTPPDRETQKLIANLVKIYGEENAELTADASTHSHNMSAPASNASNASSIHTASRQHISSLEDQRRAREMLMTNKSTASEFAFSRYYNRHRNAWDRVAPVATIDTTSSEERSGGHATHNSSSSRADTIRLASRAPNVDSAAGIGRMLSGLVPPSTSSNVRRSEGRETSASTSSPPALADQ